MIGQEDLEEIKRQAKDWSVSFGIIEQKNKELYMVEARRAKLLEELSQEEKNKKHAQNVINELIKDYEDEESVTAIEKIVSEYISPAITKGMFS